MGQVLAVWGEAGGARRGREKARLVSEKLREMFGRYRRREIG